MDFETLYRHYARDVTQSPVEVIGLAVAAIVTWMASGWYTRHLQRRVVFKPASESTRRATMGEP